MLAKKPSEVYLVGLFFLITTFVLIFSIRQTQALTDLRVGEKMSFSITFKGLLIGHGYLEVCGKETFQDKEVYHLVSFAQTEDFFASFFYLKDRVDTLVDVGNLDTIVYEKSAQEGNKSEHIKVVFNNDNNTAVVDDKTYEIIPGSRDILGSFYYLRTIPLTIGDSFTLPIYHGEHNTTLNISVIGSESLEIPAGTFETIVIRGVMDSSDGIFTGSSDFKLWLTDNDERYVAKIQAGLIIGNIDVSLININ
jgi:hypothetical protein